MASEYEQIKSAGIDPQVAELAEYHGLGRSFFQGTFAKLRDQVIRASKQTRPATALQMSGSRACSMRR